MVAATAPLREDYLAALLAGDGTRARHLVEAAAGDGTDVRALYLEVLEPALHDIGELWARGKVSVAYEHYATAITQSVMVGLAARIRVAPRGGRLAVLACTPGEQHGLGVQMLGDFLEGEGWEVLALGHSMPAHDLVALVADEQPDVVGLSTATAAMLPAAIEELALLRDEAPGPLVAVGGLGWRDVPGARVLALGADVCVAGARELVALVRRRFPPLPEDGEGLVVV